MSDLVTPPVLKDGRYVITSTLGKGGNAGVYAAFDTQLKRWRAIKVLLHGFIHDAEVRARFALEAATMARLEHENLVRVFDISDEKYTPHIVMELCAGGSIIHWMKKYGAVAPRQAVDVILATTRAVRCAHEGGVIHRDVKPQNILISGDGRIKLTDFGIAREEDSGLTQAGATIGTYAFMAPEQRHDSTTVDERADIYSLGATLFTMLQVKTTTELFIAERGDEILEGMPEPLIDVILKACSYKPANRYPDTDSLVAALEEAREQLPPDPKRPPIEALAKPQPDHAPTQIHREEVLEDLFIALEDERNKAPAPAEPIAPAPIPYTMSRGQSHSSVGRPSYIDESEYERVDDTRSVPPVAQSLPPETHPTVDEPPTDRGTPLLVLAGTVLIALIAGMGSILIGASSVNDAALATMTYRQEANEQVKRTSPAVSAAADKELEALYFKVIEAKPGTRWPETTRYVEALRSHPSAPNWPPAAQGTTKQLYDMFDDANAAREDWEDAAAGLLGSTAISMGFAQPPP